MPTLFVIDPVTEKAELRWMGSANAVQLERLLADGEYAVRQAWEQRVGTESLEDRLAQADREESAGDHTHAAKRYDALLADAPADWPRRGRVVESLVTALYQVHDWQGCATKAAQYCATLPLGSSFANTASTGLGCAGEAPSGTPWRNGAMAGLASLVERALKAPDLLADDRSGLYEALVDSKEASGDAAGARALAIAWWDFLTAEANKAPTPEARAAFDPHRVLAATKAGDPARVIPVLEASERDLPQDYNAPARLALTYRELGRYDDALAANARALAKVYGPRRLRVFEVEADLRHRKGDEAGAKKALEDAIAYAEALPGAQRPDILVEKLKKRLGEVGR